MNKLDRAKLARAVVLLQEAKYIIEAIGEAEQKKFDNLTEGLRASEHGRKMEETASELEAVATALKDAISYIYTT